MHRIACGARLAPGTQAPGAVELTPTGTGTLALAVSIETTVKMPVIDFVLNEGFFVLKQTEKTNL